MTILVDMDDTMEQLLQAWVAGVNARYGTHAAYGDVTDWDVSKTFPGLTREQVYAIPMEPGFWRTVQPVPGAAETLRRLQEKGHDVYVVTAAQYETLNEKMEGLLFKYFPFIPWEKVIVTLNKKMIRGDVMIDDGVHNLEGGDYIKLLMTAPHNITYDAAAHGMIRVNNWAEIEETIGRLANADRR